MQRVFRFIPLFLLSYSTLGQPSYGVNFRFKLYDDMGQIVDYETFCREYELLGDGDRKDQTPCTNEYLSKPGFYNDSSQWFNGRGTIVYNDLTRKFVHNGDTMLIILGSAPGGSQSFRIDSLVITPGKFYIYQRELESINFQQAALDYYNRLLLIYRYRSEIFHNPMEDPIYMELMALKRKYGIEPGDMEEKQLSEIKFK